MDAAFAAAMRPAFAGDIARNQGMPRYDLQLWIAPASGVLTGTEQIRYTNRTGAPVALPLDDAIAHEATATFRRSGKRGAAVFTWSCRLQVPNEPCF